MDHNRLWKILKEACLLRNLYPGQEAALRTEPRKTDWFQIEKGVHQICLFNIYTEYFMRNAGLDEAQTGIKLAGRNISNIRYADDTTLMAGGEEKLKSLLMKVKVHVLLIVNSAALNIGVHVSF